MTSGQPCFLATSAIACQFAAVAAWTSGFSAAAPPARAASIAAASALMSTSGSPGAAARAAATAAAYAAASPPACSTARPSSVSVHADALDAVGADASRHLGEVGGVALDAHDEARLVDEGLLVPVHHRLVADPEGAVARADR